LVDIGSIRANPKVLLGSSDTTTLHMACLRAGLVSFYGPSIMAGFAENGGLFRYLANGVRRTLFEPEPELVIPENTEGWTVEFLDWGVPANQDRRRALVPSTGWRWLGGNDAVEGMLLVGCLEVLDWLRGTPWWPDIGGAVLAVETSEEQPSPEIVRRFFRSLAASGELASLRAILFGRPGGAALNPTDHVAYDEAIVSVVRDEQRLDAIPIVTGMDFGHTDPTWTLPIGIPVRVDPNSHTVRLIGTAVAPAVR
jgi:muramoyltetrapeptide carboxypeptidase LdcA involved in peptidoglycan recycling